MGFFSKFERRVEDGFDDMGDKFFDSPISPVQIAKKAEKQMRREKMVGAGKEFAPTLYTVLVNPDDDERLFGYYPTLAGETETYLRAKAQELGLAMDGAPLVRFIIDDELKPGKFEVLPNWFLLLLSLSCVPKKCSVMVLKAKHRPRSNPLCKIRLPYNRCRNRHLSRITQALVLML